MLSFKSSLELNLSILPSPILNHLFFLVMLYPFIKGPLVPTGPVTDATSFKVTTHQFLWRPVYRGVHAHQSTSYYAGLSFKSGYQQTGYHHPILSYNDVKYYYCLKLGACGQETRGVHAKRNPTNSPTFRRALDPRSIETVRESEGKQPGSSFHNTIAYQQYLRFRLRLVKPPMDQGSSLVKQS